MRAMRSSSVTSDRSVPAQVLAQTLARAVQPRFHGLLGQAQGFGNILIAQLRDVPQDGDSAQLRADLHQSILDRLKGLLALRGAIGAWPLIGGVRIQLATRLAQRERVEAFIDRNTVEPAVEAERRVVVSEVLESLEESRLGDVQRILPIAQHPQRHVEDGLLVTNNELFKGISITFPTTQHQCRVVLLVHKI